MSRLYVDLASVTQQGRLSEAGHLHDRRGMQNTLVQTMLEIPVSYNKRTSVSREKKIDLVWT